MKVLKYIIALVILLSGVGFYLSKKLPVNIPIKVLSTDYKGDLPLERLQLPDGFEIGVFADDVENARSMTLSPSGTLFVGTRSKGHVYALQDTDGDMKADKKYTLLKGGNMPNGVAYHEGDLYVAEVNRILKFGPNRSRYNQRLSSLAEVGCKSTSGRVDLRAFPHF